MRVLSIQSSVAYGYAGNSAAVFPLQRLGHEVWPVNTVQFSNHTGYGSFRGSVFDPADIAEVIRGVGDRGAFERTDVVLSGYLGSPGVAQVVLEAVAAVKAANPLARYCCDPVMGDLGKGMFVQSGLPELIRSQVVPAADILTPNAFELAYLAGTGGDPTVATPADVTSMPAMLAAVDRLRALGPRTVLVTSIDDAAMIAPVAGGSDGEGDTGALFGLTDEGGDEYDGPAASTASHSDRSGVESETATAPATIGMLAVDDSGAYEVHTPRLPLLPNGAGDVTSALFVAHLDGADRSGGEHTAAEQAGAVRPGARIEQALARTASSVYAILAETVRQRSVEIALIDAQAAIAEPACEFPVTRVR